MYSGLRKLGETQDMADHVVQDMDEGGDVDFIAVNYMGPDSGFPPQRIHDYDEQLVQHQTLNGNGMSRMAAPFLRNYFGAAVGPRRRLAAGAPRGRGGARSLAPRFASNAVR